MDRLKGRVAIITGGASGIGEATVRLFAAEGARVVCADVQDEAGATLARHVGDACRYVHADVSRNEDVQNMVNQAVMHFGRLDILFNNAGIAIVDKTIVDMSEQEFDRTIAVNLKGTWLGMKHAIPAMLKAGGGAIVNTASTSGLLGYAAQSGYGASKGGVVNLTRHCAVEYAAQGIRANCICPGAIFTPLTMTLRNRAGMSREDAMLENARKSPLQRTGMPDDIARTALYLASDDSAHVTGQIIAVDGGATASIYRGATPEHLVRPRG